MVNKPNIFCMKKSILLFFAFIQLVVLNAQNTGIENIKHIYSSIDKSYIVENAYRRELYTSLGIDTIIDFYRDFSTIILVPTFDKKNILNYSFDKDVCDFMSVKPSNVELVYCNTLKNIVVALSESMSFYGPTYRIYYYPTTSADSILRKRYNAFSEKIIRDLSEIKKFEPDVILLASPYFQDYKNRENTNYLLLFSDRIYIYRTYYKDLIEINEYVRRHYKKPKKFVDWVMNVLYAFK